MRTHPSKQNITRPIHTLSFFGRCALLIVAILIGGCNPAISQTGPRPTETATPKIVLTISGSGTTTSVLEAIQKNFEADNPEYQLKILPGTGTTEGVKGMYSGILDVAAMVRPPKAEESAQGMAFTAFGAAGQAIYAHPDVGIGELSSQQILDIFSGKLNNWSDLGGPDLPIIIYVRDEADGSTQALREAIFHQTPFAGQAQLLTSQRAMETAVSGTIGSVGYGSWPTVRADGIEVQAISVDHVAPWDPAYKMTSPLGIGYLPTRQADLQPMVDWLLSGNGQSALRAIDVIPIQK